MTNPTFGVLLSEEGKCLNPNYVALLSMQIISNKTAPLLLTYL